MTEDLAAEHVEFQCQTLPHRFVGAQRPTNLLESTCQEITEGADDSIIAAAMLPPRERRKALLRVCSSRCDNREPLSKTPKKKKKKKKKEKKKKNNNKKVNMGLWKLSGHVF